MQTLTSHRAIEDIEFELPVIERSFNIHFDQKDLDHVKTFGDLCDALKKQLANRIDKDDCTYQQTFYKLRNAISELSSISKSDVRLETKLSDIFPKRTRRKQIRDLEKNLGIELNVLRHDFWKLTRLLSIPFILFGLSCLYIFGGFYLLPFSILMIIVILACNGRKFTVNTIRDLVELMTREHYTKSRRYPNTINGKEIETQIRKLLMDKLGFYSSEIYIKRETVI